MKARKTSSAGSHAIVNLDAINHNQHLTAFIGIRLHQLTESLYKLKMETALKPPTKRDAKEINQLEVEINKRKEMLEQRLAATKLMEVAA